MNRHVLKSAVEILGTDAFTVAGNHILLNEFTPPLEDGGLPEQVAVEGEQLAAIMERATEMAAAEEIIKQRLVDYPNLEPDQFWFVVKVSGYEPTLNNWLNEINNPESENYDPIAWAAASSKLQFAKFFERDHPFVEAAREAIGMTEQELDALWSYATQ